MKRFFVPFLACAIVLLNLVLGVPAQAGSLFSWPNGLPLAQAAASPDLLKQLETEVLPQLENILTPEQREQFKTAVGEGVTFRKAFKSLTLTPDQKTQLKALFKTLPKQDTFASLTLDQKKQLFLKKKEFFMPTSEEITEKINAGMKSKEGMGAAPAGVTDKINAAMKRKAAFMPKPDEIGEKISAGVKQAGEKAAE